MAQTAGKVESVDIAIVGAGMVGTALALALKESPYSIAIIDGHDSVSLQAQTLPSSSVDQFEARVSALTPASKNLLDDLGAWQLLSKQQFMPYQKMHVWDELGTASIDFDAAEHYCDELGYIVENKNISAALHQKLKGQKNLSTYWNNRLETIRRLEPAADSPTNSMTESKDANYLSEFKHGYNLYLQDGSQIQCGLLVAADGANSQVRNLVGIATREWDYQHHAIVATLQTELAHDSTARQRFSESGPLAFLPLQDAESSEKFCSIVWSLKPGMAKTMMALDDAQFALAVSKQIELKLGAVTAVSERFCYPLRQRHAKSYTNPAVVLVGDAAHTIHPLAGQGVNLGFKDVRALARLLMLSGEESGDCNNAVLLKRFQRERQGDNLMMMGLMEGFKQLFEQTHPLVRWARNIGMDWVDKQGLLKNQIARHAMGL